MNAERQVDAAVTVSFRHFEPLLSPPVGRYSRRWVDVWGHSLWYFETDDEGWPVRQIEVYDAGQFLRYGPGHDQDCYGGLGRASLYESGENWSNFEIPSIEFERFWGGAARDDPHSAAH